jgi:hypothetical protein
MYSKFIIHSHNSIDTVLLSSTILLQFILADRFGNTFAVYVGDPLEPPPSQSQ